MNNFKFTFLLLTILFSFSLKMNAQEIPTVKSPVSYSCSPDALSIIGTDGSHRACWPYLCSGSYCEVMCATSSDCQSNTSCGTNGICEKPKTN